VCVNNLSIEKQNGTRSKKKKGVWGGDRGYRKHGYTTQTPHLIMGEESPLDFKRKLYYFEKVILSSDL
jgi:hypothetical protein